MTLGITVSLIVATLLLLILVLSLIARHFSNRDVQIFSDLAKQYGGKVSVDSFNSSATIYFSHRGAKIKFFQRKRLSGKVTRSFLRCDLNFPNSLLIHIGKEVSSEPSISGLTNFMFVPKIDIGSPTFNKEFAVHGSDHSFIQALLNSELQKQLLSVASKDPRLYLHPTKEAVARIKGAKDPQHSLEFSLNQLSNRKEELENSIANGLAMVGRFLSATSPEPRQALPSQVRV